MATDISEALKKELRIIEVEAEFLANKPLAKPRKLWFLVTVAGLCGVFAFYNLLNGSYLLSSFLLLAALMQFLDYQWSVQANKLYDSGSEIINYYKQRSEPRT